MRQLKYNDSTILDFEFPIEWDEVSSATLTVLDTSANELLPATACSMYTPAFLLDAVDMYSTTINLALTSESLSIGDPIMIVSMGVRERGIVKGFNPITKVIELESPLENAYDAFTVVSRLSASYTLDATDTDVYTKGTVVTLVWTPTGDGDKTTERAQVSDTIIDVAGLSNRFKVLYQRAYDSFTVPVDNMSRIVFEAEQQIRQELLSNNLDYNRIVDQSLIAPALMAKMAAMWTFNGDEKIKDEREFLIEEYEKQISILKNLPIWVDSNQDLEKDDNEVTDHQHIFGRNW